MDYMSKMQKYPELNELRSILESGQPGLMTLTPLVASTVLTEFNKHNRDVSATHTQQMADAILRNEWKMNGDSISFYDDGTLHDGQHRCSAVNLSSHEIEVLVLGGIERDAVLTKDTGHARKANDALKMYGYENATETAAIAKPIWQWIILGRPSGRAPAHAELKRFVDGNDTRLKSVVSMAIEFAENHPRKVNIATVGTMLWRATDEDHNWSADMVIDFLSDVVNGEADQPSAPVARAAEVLDKAFAKKASLGELKKMAILIKAFKLHAAGKESVTPGAIQYVTKGKLRDKSFPDFDQAPDVEVAQAA